jgi:hypothetical protein
MVKVQSSKEFPKSKPENQILLAFDHPVSGFDFSKSVF